MFAVRTPTAIVTDLGTEFGVEVDKSGATQSHVFRGKVKVLVLGGTAGSPGSGREVVLGENESARVGPDRDQVVRIIRGTSGDAQPLGFARQIPRRVPIEVYNTGVELKEGDADPHWQLVARSDDPDFQPRPAVVTAVAFPFWLANYAARSQWLSTGNGPPAVPDGITYTFRTTFELADALPGTAVLRGRFIVDNHVQAIRLNGKELPVPEHGWGRLGGGIFTDGDSIDRFSEFSAKNGFVEGGNTLEIDVHNGIPPEIGGNNPMGLRVELGGHVLSGQSSVGAAVELPPQPRQPRGKEGASMN